MNHEKDEIVAMDEEVSRRELLERFSCFLLWGIRLKLMGFSFRIKMLVWQVKQQQIVVRINIRIKPMMMKKKMNLFISNQVHVHDGKNDVKLFVFLGFVFRWNVHSFFLLYKVAQRDIPGIDASYIAMDTEEGVEVVWNEVLFSERKISDMQHVSLNQMQRRLHFVVCLE